MADNAFNIRPFYKTRGAGNAGLESNVITLAPNDEIDTHIRADVDVLFRVLYGSGWLTTEERTINLATGDLVWLPRRLRRRQFTAGPNGLCYAMAHETGSPARDPSGVESRR